MPTPESPKAIFDGLEQYPLLAKTGVRDYIFYLVSEFEHGKKGYGWAARAFFGRWFTYYAEHEVGSLEELIDVLHAEVTQQGVQQIREIVIVAHANAQALLFPILAGSDATAHNLPYVNHKTLARLQQLFRANELQPFRDRRKLVIAHLHDDSWVTIRGCNFGNSHEAMYATYSFFGGRADVYAPTLFQHFGVYPMSTFARLNTPDKLHSHLVRQHFLRRDITPARKTALVEDLAEPVRFSEPYKLASTNVDNPSPEYESLVDDLNRGTRSASLLHKLSDLMASLSVPDWELSDSAQIKVVSRWPRWMISDGLTYENIRYYIYFEIWEDVQADRTSTLSVQTRLSIDHDDHSRDDTSRLQVIIQLFLNEEEDDIIHGRLFRLAGYTDVDQEPTRATRFKAVRELLDANKYSDASSPGIDIWGEFKNKLGVELAPQPHIVLQTPAVTDHDHDLDPAVWSIDDQNNHYLIKLENPSTRQGAQAHTIAVYNNITDEEQFNREVAYLADHVNNPDTPGTELAASFDRLTIDDLLGVIAYLRTPFKPGHSFYIDHAQQAIKRKEGFNTWRNEHHPEFYDPHTTAILDDSEWELRASERDDKLENSYAFDFNSTWFEVKASMPSSTVIQEDLFAEEDLVQKLAIPDDIPLSALETDSPASEFRERSAFEAPFATHPLASDKGLFDEPEEANCQEFEAAIAKAMAVKDLDAAEIKSILEQEKTASGTTFLDVLQPILSKYSFVRNMSNNVGLFPFVLESGTKVKLPWLPSMSWTDGLEPIKRVLEREVAIELSWWLEGQGAVVASTTMLQAGLGMLWGVSLALGPGKMLYHLVEEWTATDARWEAIGELTAARQWLRRVEDVTYHATSVPDFTEIDVSTPVSMQPGYEEQPFANEPYYLGRYFLEELEETNQWAYHSMPDRMKEGFDRGIVAMKFKVVDELVHRAEKGVNELLRQWHLDPCQVRVLTNAGILNVGELEAQVIGELAGEVLRKLPRVP